MRREAMELFGVPASARSFAGFLVVRLSKHERRFLLRVDAGPFHCQRPLRREARIVARLERRNLLCRARRFGGVALTQLAHRLLGTFSSTF